MPLFQVNAGRLTALPPTTFVAEKVMERKDLQQLLLADISALDNDLMVIGEEFGDWEDSKRRIDLLCLDKKANLVVVEIKRTEDGGHMELQAIRYAAMVASMTLDRVIATYARRIKGDDAKERAAKEVLEFLEVDSVDEIELTGDVRIILVSGDFSSELTTAVIYLNKHNLDITCIRFQPYKLGDTMLIDVSQIIPLPEAADYEVKVREQEQEVRKVRTVRQEIFRKFWSQLIERSKTQTQLLANRSTSSDHWLSAGIGRSGFGLSLSLTEDRSRVECYIRDANKPDTWNTAAFESLKANQEAIEKSFGQSLNWDELPGRKGCRISFDMDGGWKIPMEAWPEHQEKLIAALIKFEAALRQPIQQLAV
jgi:Domain of unknown function (DUF4268)